MRGPPAALAGFEGGGRVFRGVNSRAELAQFSAHPATCPNAQQLQQFNATTPIHEVAGESPLARCYEGGVIEGGIKRRLLRIKFSRSKLIRRAGRSEPTRGRMGGSAAA
ncbi:hypothetical protein KM043_011679 [Ampulex compressa]|nr:hypothetical protein KM043_011679 [Ampulex compressa]